MIKTKPAIITITPASILTDCPLMQINQSLLGPPNAPNRALKGSKRRHTSDRQCLEKIPAVSRRKRAVPPDSVETRRNSNSTLKSTKFLKS